MKHDVKVAISRISNKLQNEETQWRLSPRSTEEILKPYILSYKECGDPAGTENVYDVHAAESYFIVFQLEKYDI